MTQDSGETLKPTDLWPVNFGEWVRPFEEYDDTLYKKAHIFERLKIVQLKDPENCLFDLSLTRPTEASEEFDKMAVPPTQWQEENRQEVLIVLPSGARIIQRYEIPKVEKEYEIRLLALVISQNKPSKDRRFAVRLPSGEELAMDSSDTDLTTYYSGGNFRGKSFAEIMVPDTVNVAGRIEVKVAKTKT